MRSNDNIVKISNMNHQKWKLDTKHNILNMVLIMAKLRITLFETFKFSVKYWTFIDETVWSGLWKSVMKLLGMWILTSSLLKKVLPKIAIVCMTDQCLGFQFSVFYFHFYIEVLHGIQDQIFFPYLDYQKWKWFRKAYRLCENFEKFKFS